VLAKRTQLAAEVKPRKGRRRRVEQRLDTSRHLEVQFDSLLFDDRLADILIDVFIVVVVVAAAAVIDGVIIASGGR
jgi:hypothetical protein